MKKITFLVLVISLFFVASCDNLESNTKQPGPFPKDDSIPEDLIIRLKRTPCYGECPAYMLTVKANGKVDFFGQDFTETKGQAEGEISVKKIKQLIKLFKQTKFFELKDNYITENCATDNPRVRTTLFINGKVKKIEHDLGCKAPEELTELENKIDEVVGSKKWIGKPKKSKGTNDENPK